MQIPMALTFCDTNSPQIPQISLPQQNTLLGAIALAVLGFPLPSQPPLLEALILPRTAVSERGKVGDFSQSHRINFPPVWMPAPPTGWGGGGSVGGLASFTSIPPFFIPAGFSLAGALCRLPATARGAKAGQIYAHRPFSFWLCQDDAWQEQQLLEDVGRRC